MSIRQSLKLFVSFLLLTLTACASQVKAEPTPPTIHYGEDVCEFCGMIISDERYAAGYITQDGQQHIFDDIGDMFQAHLAKQDEVTAFFVNDYESKNWLRAETAAYVRSPELTTPMLSGLAACATTEKANILAETVQGEVLTFEGLLAYYQAKPAAAANNGSQHQHMQHQHMPHQQMHQQHMQQQYQQQQ